MFIEPIWGPECWPSIQYRGATVPGEEVFLLLHNGGIPSRGDIDLDLLKQLVERQMAEQEQKIEIEQTASADCCPAAPTEAPAAVVEVPVVEVPPQTEELAQNQNLEVQLIDLPQFTGSRHFQIELPEGISLIRYSLTQSEQPVWQEVEVTSCHLRLPVQSGIWHFKVQAVADDGTFGPMTTRIFTEGGEDR